MRRRLALLLVILSLSLSSCVSIGNGGVSGLNSYVDTLKGFQFLYPNGWQAVKVNSGPDLVMHDVIEQTENLSVVISPVPDNKTLTELGTPGEVGYSLMKNAIAPSDSGRKAELVNAESREVGDKTYYILEYDVKLPNQDRHDIASVAVSRGKLFTFNASTTQKRWQKIHNRLETVAKSFSVY